MKHDIHLNTEFIRGFIEALIYEYEEGLGPFLSDIHDYTILVKEEDDLVKVTIPYAIISDNRADLNVYLELSKRTSMEAFRLKVNLCIDEIRSRVVNFKKDQTDDEE